MDNRATLLLVGDDREALDRYALVFRNEGYRVFMARTGAEALELAREHRPDVVVLDARLPDVSGADVRAQIKSSEELKDVLALLLSARDARRRSEAYYRALIEHSTDIITVLNPDGTIRYESPSLTRTLGYDPEELIGKYAFDLVHPEDAAGAFEEFTEHAAEEGVTRVAELRFRHKDGSWRVLESVGTPVPDVAGEPGIIVNSRDITDRRRAEEILREREAQLRILFEESGVGHVQSDPLTRRFLRVNRRYCEITGYSADELATMTFDEITHPDDREAGSREFDAYVAGEKAAYSVEKRYVRKDGSVVWVHVTSTLVRDAAGEPRTAVAVVEDITERRRAEEALLESQNLFHSFMNNSPAVAYMKDERGRFIYLNKTFERALGVSLADWQGKTDFELWPEEIARRYVENDRTALESGTTLETVELVQQNDGPHEWLTFKFPVEGASGRKFVAGVGVDITARRRAEEQLVRISRAVEGTSDAIGIADATGRAIYHNPAFVHLLGYAPDELNEIGGPPALFGDAAVRQEVFETIGGGGSWRGEVELRARDGRVVPVELKADAVKDQEGRIIGLIGICTDVAARRKAARALEESREQLRQSQKMEAIGRLAGGVAHDFNNLLTVITGYSDFALQKLHEDDPVHPLIDEVRRAAERAAALTRQLLAFGRKQMLQPKLVDLNATVSDMGRLLGRLIGEDVELVQRLDPALGRVLVDPGQVEQVIVNLAVNARDAMPGGGKLTITTSNVEVDEGYLESHADARAGSFVALALADTGVGMSEEVRQRVFEPFFTTKEAGKGTGLGLSTVYGIVKQSGGFISLETEEGRGSAFTVYLPRADAEEEEPEREAEAAELARGSETVLVVEDEGEVRRLAAVVLERAGYTVLVASNGGEALLLCEAYKHPIHLMLTDVVMPRMSGRQLAERLAPLRPGMKVLYTSGYTDDAIVHHGLLEGEIAFLAKPFTPGALLRTVRQVLDGP